MAAPYGFRIGADITDKKHIEEVNLQQQKRLEQTSRLITMGEMASSLAHELNQPLSAIANYCAGCVKRMQGRQLSSRTTCSPPCRKASSQAERAGKIIRRMRDMVKKGDPNRQPIALEELVDETRAFADIEAPAYCTQIIVDLPDNLPRIVVDRIMIEQVLLNLVKNGIEAMIDVPFERRQLTLQAKIVDERMLEISVTDQGHGLDEADIEKIFAPFYTTNPKAWASAWPSAVPLSSSTRGACGSNPGAKVVPSSISPYPSRKLSRQSMSNQTQTIYVVDDDEAMRDSMTWLLEGEAYRVACFDSAESFLKAWRNDMHGCLVLDVRMPEMSGLELQEKLDTMGSQLPVIFVTGHGDVPMAVSALQRGACDFIEKPFHNEDCCRASSGRSNWTTSYRPAASATAPFRIASINSPA